jgi:hypothetical protein
MRAAFVFAVFVALASAACSKTANVVESRALTVDFASYKTGTVEVEPKGIEGGEKASLDMLAYLEKQLKQQGVLEPASIEGGAQLIVRLRAAAHNDADEDFRVLVDFVDAKSRATVGQVTVAGSPLNDKTGAALRRIADEVVAYMRANRKTPVGAKGATKTAQPAPSAAAPAASAAPKRTCTITCTPDSSSALPPDDQKRIAEKVEPMLAAVRACLDNVSAQSIHPAAILRFEVAGQLSQLKIDAGGYDNLDCVNQAAAHPPRVRVIRAASVRCDYRCQ